MLDCLFQLPSMSLNTRWGIGWALGEMWHRGRTAQSSVIANFLWCSILCSTKKTKIPCATPHIAKTEALVIFSVFRLKVCRRLQMTSFGPSQARWRQLCCVACHHASITDLQVHCWKKGLYAWILHHFRQS